MGAISFVFSFHLSSQSLLTHGGHQEKEGAQLALICLLVTLSNLSSAFLPTAMVKCAFFIVKTEGRGETEW